jgi:hypothetical protein
MTIPQMQLAPWTRKHDKPGTPHIAQAPVIMFPRGLEDLVQICQTRPPNKRIRAAGSHWALSEAAVSDNTFIETHDFNEIFPAMGQTLFNVVPRCLSAKFLERFNDLSERERQYFYHFESGKRIYQLYAEMDRGDANEPRSLAALMASQFGNHTFQGSWAFQTLGGAGGQTVVGALSTGTHGGDFDRPPVADCVVALHVVTDGGKHLWIERSNDGNPMTDPAKLQALFGATQFGGSGNFEVHYDDGLLKAALVQVGRFGIIYSAVIKVIPQYGLRSELLSDTWENVRSQIADPSSNLFIKPFTSPTGNAIPQHFLQIAINPIPLTDGTTHGCSVTRHWTLPLGEVPASPLAAVNWSGNGNPAGRPERVGNLVLPLSPILKAPLFANAGKSLAFSPDESGVTSFNLFDFACADANFMDGIVSGIFVDIENFLNNNSVTIGGGLGAVVAAGGADTLLALAPWLLLILAILAAFLNSLRNDGSTVGQAFNDLRQSLLSNPDPNARAAGLLVWRAIAAEVWNTQQSPLTFSAISYAVFDGHNYRDISCTVNVRSVEVFFKATDPHLLQFVDRLLQFEIDQEFSAGLSVAGYVSLRFVEESSALIAPQPFARTVAVECSGLADENGSTQFVDFAVALAQDPNIKGILHWGQQNASTQQQIEFRFGDAPGSPTGPLHDWRQVLAELTNNGQLDGFSNHFTRTAGLEVVQPVMAAGAFVVLSPPTTASPSCTVGWNCANNPTGSVVTLDITAPGSGTTQVTGRPLVGNFAFPTNTPGTYRLTLRVAMRSNGTTREASQMLSVVMS